MFKSSFAALLLVFTGIAFTPLSYAQSALSINGAGATFPYPLYSKWFSEFRKVDPSVEINYQSIGSGGGIRQLTEKTIDFGASDAPMKDEQLKKAGEPILHFPMILGAVVLTYNLGAVTAPLRLTPEVVADLFLGKIFYWNDPRIQALNIPLALPDVPVMIVHRSDGSGTTAVFTDYLSKISPEWKEKAGSGSQIKWPVGLGGKGNEGVTGFVKHSPGALGYVELLYAEKNQLPAAVLQNREGRFVAPASASITAAADAELPKMPEDFRLSIVNAGGAASYPIASFTYLLFYEKTAGQQAGAKIAKMKEFLRWSMGEGQRMAAGLFYAPLPESLIRKVLAQIERLKVAAPAAGEGSR